MSSLDPKILAAIIAAVAAIIGALVGAIAKGYSSREKLLEREFEYEKRLQAGYLERAREYVKGVYIPLSIETTKLNAAFHSYRTVSKKDLAKERTKQAAETRMKNAIEAFLAKVYELGNQGANAFLTTDLDESLQGFCEFLRSSLTATETNIKAVFKFDLSSLPLIGALRSEKEYILSGKMAQRLRTGSRLSVDFGGIGLTYMANEMLAAPLVSVDFEERFVRDIHTINVLVKEVTLGSKARS